MNNYLIREVSGLEHCDTIRSFNAMDGAFPPLTHRHLELGYWFFAYWNEIPVAFAGLVEMFPFPRVGYLKRCYVDPSHRGQGLQQKLLYHRELKAKELGWSCLVGEVREENEFSNLNFEQCDYERVIPEQPWALDSVFWVKHL
jgi:GNAT superfamily N-acetyltransferase